MKSMHALVSGLLGVAGVFVANSAHSQSVIFQCNACNEASYEKMAIGLGIGNHLIGDFTNDILEGFHVTREPAGDGKYTYELDPLTITALQQEAFNAYYTVITTYHSNAILVNVPNPRPAGYPVNYDGGNAIVWASQPQYYNAINEWLINLQNAAGADGPDSWMQLPASAALLALQTGIDVSGFSPVLQFQIQVTDKTVVTFRWDSSGKATELSVVDPYGNNVPIKNQSGTTNFNGTYNIPAAGNPVYLNQLVNYLNQLGAGLANTGQGGTVAIICSGAKCFITYPN